MADGGLEPDEISVGVGDEELSDSRLFGVTNPVPLRFRWHEEWVVGFA